MNFVPQPLVAMLSPMRALLLLSVTIAVGFIAGVVLAQEATEVRASPPALPPTMLAHVDTTVLHAKDGLDAAREALRVGKFADAAALAADAAGLRGAALQAGGDAAGACALYEVDRADSSHGVAAAWRAAQCRVAAKDITGALAAFTQVLASPLGEDLNTVHAVATFVDANDLALPTGVLPATTMRVGTFDVQMRELLAQVLDVVRRRGPADAARAANARLANELFDTAVGSTLPQPKLTTLPAVLSRARVLEQAHHNDAVVALLGAYAKVGGSWSQDDCDAHLLLAKAQRKLRHPAAAQAEVALVLSHCGGEVKKKAAYLRAKVAALGKRASGVAALKAFVDAYPQDALADDVLLWWGQTELATDNTDAGRAVLQRLIDEHPSGDMVHEARFALALSLFGAGHIDSAHALLVDAQARAGDRVEVSDRARYWQGRVQALPVATSLTPTTDVKALAEGTAALRALASSRPASFYGHLARQLLLTVLLPTDAAVRAALQTSPRAREVADRAQLTLSNRLSADARMRTAMAFLAAGYDVEAQRVLWRVISDQQALSEAPLNDTVAIALLLGRAGAPGAAHALLRDTGHALLPGAPGDVDALTWSLDWPRAYPDAIQAAATQHALPLALLFGLAREESVFDAQVVSWAGAVGLCQLMPTTAADEAMAAHLAAPSIDDLRAPELNARLGAAHLQRRISQLKHPLLAIAAYNAGPGAVLSWRPTGPVDWWVEHIPVDETRGYVRKVTGSWVTYSALDGSVDDVAFSMVLP